MTTNHRIHRAAIELSGHDAALTDTAGVRDWCADVLLEELDAALSELCPDGQVLVLNTLHLDLTLSDWSDMFSAELKTALRQQIREQLKALPTNERQMSVGEYHARIVLHYLRNGVFSERFSESEWSELKSDFLEVSINNNLFFNELTKSLLNRSVFIRWYALLGELALLAWLDAAVPLPSVRWQAMLQRILERMPVELAPDERPIQALLRKIIPFLISNRDEPKRLLATLLKSLFSPERLSATKSHFLTTAEAAEPDAVDSFLIAVFQSIGPLSSDHSEQQVGRLPETGARSALLESGIVTPIAGLVLTAQFLPPFLRSLDLVGPENRLVDVHRLPMLLFFIATGQTKAEEWELALPKILCGLPLSETCDTEIEVSDTEKREIDTLLTTLIEHWQRLGNTSPDGLRGTFLQRTGRLSVEREVFRLRIPEETVDILLTFVPWSFRLVRFSWMERLLIVEWGT